MGLQEIKEVYKNESEQTISYKGLIFINDNFKKYLNNRVSKRFYDIENTKELVKEAKDSLPETGFDEEKLIEIFKSQREPKNWLIGETLAECLLEDNSICRFHYDYSRDAKNPNTNQTGADLVGFSDVNEETYFTFGEVKTSSDKNSPPKVLYGRTGMVKQIEDLKDLDKKRKALVRWLWNKAMYIRGQFYSDCKKALRNYIENGNKIKLIGVLVRDTDVTKRDLHARAKALNNNIPDEMDIELFAIYTNCKMANHNWVEVMNEGD